jgi:nucleotide-binding universal stress UspA family protein
MYINILVPTDGSELIGKAVEHGIALAKRIGAKVTALTVLQPFHTFTTDTQMIEDTPAQYKIRVHDHAEKTLGAVVRAAQAAGVACETVQVEHEHPLPGDHRHRRGETLRRPALTSSGAAEKL